MSLRRSSIKFFYKFLYQFTHLLIYFTLYRFFWSNNAFTSLSCFALAIRFFLLCLSIRAKLSLLQNIKFIIIIFKIKIYFIKLFKLYSGCCFSSSVFLFWIFISSFIFFWKSFSSCLFSSIYSLIGLYSWYNEYRWYTRSPKKANIKLNNQAHIIISFVFIVYFVKV